MDIKKTGFDLRGTLRSLKTKEGRRAFYTAHKPMILYVVIGIGTTFISLGSYYLIRIIFPDAESVPAWLSWIFNITSKLNIESSTALPVILSWILANFFSFFATRTTVFASQADNLGKVLLELLKFFSSRILTLLVDIVIMFVLVDVTNIHGGLYEFCAKVFSNLVVLILNYILSRIFVFRKKKALPAPAPECAEAPQSRLYEGKAPAVAAGCAEDEAEEEKGSA